MLDINSTLYTMDWIWNSHWILTCFWAVFMIQFICNSNLDWLKAALKLRLFITMAQAVLILIENKYYSIYSDIKSLYFKSYKSHSSWIVSWSLML